MADKSIGELITASGVTPTDLFVLEQNGVAKKLTGQTLENWLVSFADGHGGIHNIEKLSTIGLKDTYRITFADQTTFDFTVTNGRGIRSIYKSTSSGLRDIYTINFTDNTSDSFTVTNGAKGDKGDNTYTWIKYASQEPTASSHSFGDVPDDWIGVYFGSSDSAPTDWQEYKWYKIKGEKGNTGTAATLKNSSITYAVGDSGTVPPISNWSESIPSTPQGQFLWTKTVLTFNTGSPITYYSVSRASIDAQAHTGAGAHNSVYRGENLGTTVTDAQYAAIEAGTFDDMYIGDYWTIGGVTYRIAAFDYYYNTGDTACTTHHVTLVPEGDMYTHRMNDTNVATGAYVGSKMYTEGLNAAKETINTAFGAAHVLNHRQYLQNAVTDGYASGGSWYDSTVELMTERNVYGGKVFGNCQNGTALPNSYTVDKSQYPLFAFRPDMISNRKTHWLRDVVTGANFAYVNGNGLANHTNASYDLGVRPAFSIIG